MNPYEHLNKTKEPDDRRLPFVFLLVFIIIIILLIGKVFSVVLPRLVSSPGPDAFVLDCSYNYSPELTVFDMSPKEINLKNNEPIFIGLEWYDVDSPLVSPNIKIENQNVNSLFTIELVSQGENYSTFKITADTEKLKKRPKLNKITITGEVGDGCGIVVEKKDVKIIR